MDAAILAIAPAAQRQQGRAIAQVDAELLLDRAAQLGTGQRGDEPGETRPIFQTLDRIAAVPPDLRKITDQRCQHVAPQKFLDDDEFERVADERCGAQTVEIEDVQEILQGSSTENNEVFTARSKFCPDCGPPRVRGRAWEGADKIMRGGESMTGRARDLRRNMTEAERALWHGLAAANSGGAFADSIYPALHRRLYLPGGQARHRSRRRTTCARGRARTPGQRAAPQRLAHSPFLEQRHSPKPDRGSPDDRRRAGPRTPTLTLPRVRAGEGMGGGWRRCAGVGYWGSWNSAGVCPSSPGPRGCARTIGIWWRCRWCSG